MPMIETPTVPADPNYALPRNTTDFGEDAQLLATYLRLGWKENALREIERMTAENGEHFYACDPYAKDDDFIPPYDESELERITDLLEAMPPPHSHRQVQRGAGRHRAREHHPSFERRQGCLRGGDG